MSIQKRKKDHVELTVNEDVFYNKTTGFELYDFVHNALPEVNSDSVDLKGKLLGRSFDLPFFVSSMTGGYADGESVNAKLASFCEKMNLPLGVGSQRAMIENPEETSSFSVVRKHAPNAFIAANIGGAQLIGGLAQHDVNRMIESIHADAIIIHLNPLQELMQPEGDRNFKGIEKGIQTLVESSDIPVIVKETGAGLSADVAKRLLEAGVAVLDTAGAGGTSWAKVENLRQKEYKALHHFNDWGLPTAVCVKNLQVLRSDFEFELIASGGIRDAFDIVKAVALGADFAAAAQPVIKSLMDSGEEGLERWYYQLKNDCKIILTLLGCTSFNDLDYTHLRKISDS
jgi:isopentenyl-diphosphate delta-isomerase